MNHGVALRLIYMTGYVWLVMRPSSEEQVISSCCFFIVSYLVNSLLHGILLLLERTRINATAIHYEP